MIFPRGREQQARYGRHKVIAILVTFAVFWIAIRFLFPGEELRLESLFPAPSPEELFAERRSGVLLELEGVVEAVLPDTTTPGAAAPVPRVQLRTLSGHPLTVLDEAGAVGDTVHVRGIYHWDPRGGRILAEGATTDGGETPPAP